MLDIYSCVCPYVIYSCGMYTLTTQHLWRQKNNKVNRLLAVAARLMVFMQPICTGLLKQRLLKCEEANEEEVRCRNWRPRGLAGEERAEPLPTGMSSYEWSNLKRFAHTADCKLISYFLFYGLVLQCKTCKM